MLGPCNTSPDHQRHSVKHNNAAWRQGDSSRSRELSRARRRETMLSIDMVQIWVCQAIQLKARLPGEHGHDDVGVRLGQRLHALPRLHVPYLQSGIQGGYGQASTRRNALSADGNSCFKDSNQPAYAQRRATLFASNVEREAMLYSRYLCPFVLP